MKKNKLTTLAALFLLSGFVVISCSNPLTGDRAKAGSEPMTDPGVLTVTIGDAGASAARTIVPVASDLPVIASYELALTCAGQTTKTAIYTAPTLSGSFSLLVPGTWTVSVIGKTTGGTIVASGTSNVTVTASASAAVTVTLAYITASATDSGSMAITLTFPKSVGIDSVTARIDGTDQSLAITDNGDSVNDKVVCAASGITTPAPLVRISFKKSGVVLLTWVERVWVYKNVTTTNSSALDAASFNTAPPAPGSLTPGALQPDGKVTLSWPNVETAESYTLERSNDGGTMYTEVGGAISAGTLSYTDTLPCIEKTYKYRLSATNAFGTSASTVSTIDVAVTPAFIVAYDKSALELGFLGAETASTILNNLTLATTGSPGTSISWASSNAAVATNGAVTRPAFTEFATGDATVTLTATVTNNGASVTKAFPMTVIRQPGVSFNANTGSGSTAALAIATGSSANLSANAFTKTGYSFAGWAETPAGAVVKADGESYSMASAVPVILYAKWTASSYTLTFNGEGGTTPTSQSATYASTYGALPTTTRSGYTFGGWYTGTGGTGTNIVAGTTVTITAAQTLYAKWTVLTYNIIYNLAGGTNAGGNPSTYTVASALITLAAPTRSSYTFTNWTPESSIPAGSTGNKTFTATWVLAPFTITYNLDGGTNAAGNLATYTASTPRPMVFAAPTRSGYAFSGWFSDSGFITALPALQESTSGNIVLYAKWTAVSATNPALGCWVTTSGTEAGYDLPGYYAVDGNEATRWSSQKLLSAANPAWILLDLGSVKPLIYITIHWEAAPFDFYEITTSIDGVTWTSLGSSRTAPATNATKTEELAFGFQMSSRYWKISANGTKGTAGISIYEITFE